MLPEQQQRILGYFIEEARDHLNTIEQGLLNLQNTLNDPEMINEVFRAAHSIKGGAAMLGLTSIQHTSHRLEDFFKVLKEHPIQIDQKLESLFLGVCDTLKTLLDNLSSPYGFSEEAAITLMSETEPVFQWLHEHLELLVQQASSRGVKNSDTSTYSPPPVGIDSPKTITQIFLREDSNSSADASVEVESPAVICDNDNKNWGEFETQVLQTLREMLQLFKQSASATSRQNLEQCCHQLVGLGQKFQLPKWCSLCQAAANAIANPENTYLTLAKIVITEFKQAQELVLQGRDAEVSISPQLQALLNFPEIELLEITPDLLEQPVTQPTGETATEQVLSTTNDDFVNSNKNTIVNLSELSEQLLIDEEIPSATDNSITETFLVSGSLSHHEHNATPTNSNIDQNGPEVGIAELTTLAHLFEGEIQELDENWQKAEILDLNSDNASGIINDNETEEIDSDLADFLSFENENISEEEKQIETDTEDLNLLFDDNLLESSHEELPNNSQTSAASLDLSNIADDDVVSSLLGREINTELQPQSDLVFGYGEKSPISAFEKPQPPTEVNLPQTERAVTPIELSTSLQNSFDDLFSDSEPQKISPINQPENISLEHLFDGLAENTILPTSESAIEDLFFNISDEDETTLKLHLTEDDTSSFWNQEVAAEQQPAVNTNVEQDVMRALEENLLAAATASFEFEDLDLNLLQPEQELDLNITSDIGDDLFGDFTPNSTTNLSAVSDSGVFVEESINFQSENSSTAVPPEALDFVPEFTNQPREIALGENDKAFTDVEFQFLDERDEIADTTHIHATYIQLDSTDNPINDLLPQETTTLDTDFDDREINIKTEVLDIQLDKEIDISQAAKDDFALLDDLLANDTTLLLATKAEALLENNSFAPRIVTDSDLGENGLNFPVESADLPDSDLNIDQISEVKNAVASSPQLADTSESETYIQDELADLEALLVEAPSRNTSNITAEDFAALEALLGTDNDEHEPLAPALVYPQLTATNQTANNPAITVETEEDEFSDLEKLLAQTDKNISVAPLIKPYSGNTGNGQRSANRRGGKFEETMKVPVKQLDEMSNLVGELVVNRNTLEQDHERLRQSLDNLLIQVQQLSNVGARMQELYERSLLEASLLASRKHKEFTHDSHAERGFSELEMDRFTPFHTLSQEMIEMIVRVRESASDIDFVTEETERVARQFRQVTTQLQEGLTRARMVPFSQTIDRLRRGVRDNAIKYGKQVELVIEGGDTLIDKMILDHLTDPLTHMLNNAIAHGIETPEERLAHGKSPIGFITIRAFHQGNQTVISVGDDGAGIDPERVKKKALKLGMITPGQAQLMSRLDVYDLLFQSGFTIKDQADEMSGRGVGMDVVRSEISEIRGTVSTDSAIGKGTTFTIRLPLTLSICKALCCVSDRARIAFPMDGVEDTLDIPVKNIQHTADGQTFISWRDTILPFRPLKDLLSFNRQLSRGNVYGGNRDDDMVSVVVVRSGNSLLALQIDLVLSEQEIVIKQFESPAPKPIGVAGATVLGDGRIMPIADVLEIMDIFQGRISKQSGGTSWQQKPTANLPEATTVKIDPTVLIVDDSITVRELLSLTFNKAGYRVEQARDGQEAWDKLRSGLPCDIVFCDIEMPRCDGLELLSRIQKDNNLNHLPIAMLTSRGADKHRQMAIQLGASGYFTKPYLEEALLEAASRMLKGEKLVTTSHMVS